ncbi:Oryzain alpha chain [Toxocara canis]|uniref:Oryzain alpha chain n=1 Tax=Toxocara canis TaxID=6265 RepID=A0A0B2VPY4_TOXCA|nr:Oryzain alpha chain [Toxocara canis]
MKIYKKLLFAAQSARNNECDNHSRCYMIEVDSLLMTKKWAHLSRKKIAVSILLCILVGCAVLFIAKEFLTCEPNVDPTESIIAKMSDISNEDRAYVNDFVKFKHEYGRHYNSDDEVRFRFRNFARNMNFIRESQKGNDNVLFGITSFTDWSEEEMKAMTCEDWRANEVGTKIMDDYPEESAEVFGRPDSFDWRTKGVVTDIKDQKGCGSCWAFGAVGVVESMNAIAKNPLVSLSEQELLTEGCGSCWAFGAVGVVESMNAIAKNPLVSLSEQELIDCDLNDNGCSGGYRPYAFQYVRSHGIVSEKDYPYKGEEQEECAAAGKRVYIKSIKYIGRNEEAMADFVYYKGPISVGINVTKELFHYRSGVFAPKAEDCEGNSQGSHALAVVGYGTQNGEDYWLIKNSWGKSWGMDGYLLYKRGENSCGIANTPFSVEA